MKVVAKALLMDEDGNLLLLNRGLTHPNFPGHFDLPGGEVEEGEPWDIAVAREIFEEAGISVTTEHLKKLFEKQHPTVLHALYTAKLSSKKPPVKLSWEHSAFHWIPPKKLLSLPLPEGVDKYYADVIEHLKNRNTP